MFQCHTPEDAARIVRLLNQAEQVQSLREALTQITAIQSTYHDADLIARAALAGD